ncbi:hypothetical protein CA85_47710 [Allorhodopirellula solitaria]|uniref:Methanolan biosynthesis EpsI domain-containing protein n=2 Tax=Allorhodopirellula solitaria TaxID=2527987 RepID=A0A5C5X145_9BACT|nr:hypothetical protein CA85_47710 [Allorhodopirellula solitaria]
MRIAATAVLVTLTLFAGVVHGYLDGRWSVNADLRAVGSKLDDLPEQVGDWRLVETTELDEGAAELLRCYGSTVRIYENAKTGAAVNVALLFGPRGPIAVHTPEICYSSVGTNQTGERKAEQITAAGLMDSLWSVQFAVKPDPNPSLDVWYGWSDGGAWEARPQPRFWLTENLYKIQVAGPAGDETSRPVEEFLRVFLPMTHPQMGSS